MTQWFQAHWQVAFWGVLAVFYFALAVVSLVASRRFGGKLKFASRMWVDENRELNIGAPPEPGQKVLLDYWRDLGAYLNQCTYISAAGFVLAAGAAAVSY